MIETTSNYSNQKCDNVYKWTLQEQMANKVSEEGSDAQKDWQVDHLIHQHQNQMEHLNDKLQETKERQEQILMEKLQAKKLRKERCGFFVFFFVGGYFFSMLLFTKQCAKNMFISTELSQKCITNTLRIYLHQ